MSRIFILLAYLIISFRLKIGFLGVFTAPEVSSLSVKTQPRGLDGANVYWVFLGHKEPLKSICICKFCIILFYYFKSYFINYTILFYNIFNISIFIFLLNSLE